MIRKFLERMLELIKKTDITSLEVKKNGLSLKLKTGPSFYSKPKSQNSRTKFIQRSENIGIITKILVKTGEEVKKGQPLIQVKSLGIINEILSEKDGVLQEISIREGEIVEFGEKLFVIEIKENIS